MAHVVIRHAKAITRLGVCRSKYWDEILPLLEVVQLGPKSGGVTERSLDRFIEARIRGQSDNPLPANHKRWPSGLVLNGKPGRSKAARQAR